MENPKREMLVQWLFLGVLRPLAKFRPAEWAEPFWIEKLAPAVGAESKLRLRGNWFDRGHSWCLCGWSCCFWAFIRDGLGNSLIARFLIVFTGLL